MTKEEILEGNKLIAEFMGGKFFADTGTILEQHIVSPSGYAVKCIDKLKYHTAWDWLMPVVEKIRLSSERFVLVQNSGSVILRTNDGKQTRDFDCQIQQPGVFAVWQAVTQFITWYNSTNPTTIK